MRDVDLAVLEPLDQVLRGKVDEFDIVGAVDDRIRHRFPDPDTGDAGNDVVQTLDMLDVERAVHVDAGRQEFLDIEVALRMPAAGCVGVRQLVHQHELGSARENGVEVHLVHRAATILDGLATEPCPIPPRAPPSPWRPCVSTTPMTTSTPSRCRAWAAVSISYVLPTPGAAPRNILKRPRALLAATHSAGRPARGDRLGRSMT